MLEPAKCLTFPLFVRFIDAFVTGRNRGLARRYPADKIDAAFFYKPLYFLCRQRHIMPSGYGVSRNPNNTPQISLQ